MLYFLKYWCQLVTYDFLLVFDGIYVSILYYFWDIITYLRKFKQSHVNWACLAHPLQIHDDGHKIYKSSAVAEMRDHGHNRHGPKKGGLLFPLRGELGPRLIQCGLGRGLLPYQVVSSSIQLFGHNRPPHHTIRVLRPFFRDHPGQPVPEENFWTLWCKGRLTETETRPSGWTPVVGWLEFNVPFQHKYCYIRDERSGVESYPLTWWMKASDILT